MIFHHISTTFSSYIFYQIFIYIFLFISVFYYDNLDTFCFIYIFIIEISAAACYNTRAWYNR